MEKDGQVTGVLKLKDAGVSGVEFFRVCRRHRFKKKRF